MPILAKTAALQNLEDSNKNYATKTMKLRKWVINHQKS
jgi:hypothetical protein